MLSVKDNFKNEYGNDLSCTLKCGQYEDQRHLLDCDVIIRKCDALYNDTSVNYEDIFGTGTKQLEAVQLFTKVLETRKLIEEEIATREPGPVHNPSAVDKFCLV